MGIEKAGGGGATGGVVESERRRNGPSMTDGVDGVDEVVEAEEEGNGKEEAGKKEEGKVEEVEVEGEGEGEEAADAVTPELLRWLFFVLITVCQEAGPWDIKMTIIPFASEAAMVS